MTGRCGASLDETHWSDAIECLWALSEEEKAARRTMWLAAAAHYRKPPDMIDPKAFTRWDGTAFEGTIGDLAAHAGDVQHMARRRQAKDRGKNIKRAMTERGWSEAEAVRKLGYQSDEYILPD